MHDKRKTPTHVQRRVPDTQQKMGSKYVTEMVLNTRNIGPEYTK